MNIAFLFTLILFLCSTQYSINAFASDPIARPDTLPVPKGVKDMLFYLQRDPDSNTIVYVLNRNETGMLNENDPIRIFWIRYENGGKQEDLNYMQRKFAYGLQTKKLGTDNYELRLVSYSSIPLYLRKGADGKYRVFTSIDEEEAILDRIFVRIDGGSFWSPNILYVELKGRDAVTKKLRKERFKP